MAIWIVWLKKPVKISGSVRCAHDGTRRARSARSIFVPCICLILTVSSTHAQELPHASPVPGGIAILPLVPDTEPAPVVHFADQRVMVMRHDGRWQAVVGLPLTLDPGPQTGSARDSQGKTREYPVTLPPQEDAVQSPP